MSQQAMQPLAPVHGTASLTFRNTLATQRNRHLILIDFSAINAFNKAPLFGHKGTKLKEKLVPVGTCKYVDTSTENILEAVSLH